MRPGMVYKPLFSSAERAAIRARMQVLLASITGHRAHDAGLSEWPVIEASSTLSGGERK